MAHWNEDEQGLAVRSDDAVEARQGFGEQSVRLKTEATTAALEARATATVQARFIMAERRPRSWMDVRKRLLAECQRPGFADAAIYALPRGGKTIEGLSIRFAEAALRLAGNGTVDVVTVEETRTTRTLRIEVTDLETNSSWGNEVTISKTVERRDVKPGMLVLSERKNSTGQTVYLVLATEEELHAKQQAMLMRIARNNILKLIPADILDECTWACNQTLEKSAGGENILARRNRLFDAYLELGVSPSELQGYLGKDPNLITAKDLTDLQKLYQALKEGHARWADVYGDRKRERGEVQAPPPPAAEEKKGLPAQTASAAQVVEFPKEKAPAETKHEPKEEKKRSTPPKDVRCMKCGAVLDAENSSKLKDGKMKHIGCPRDEAAPKEEPRPTEPAEPSFAPWEQVDVAAGDTPEAELHDETTGEVHDEPPADVVLPTKDLVAEFKAELGRASSLKELQEIGKRVGQVVKDQTQQMEIAAIYSRMATAFRQGGKK